MERCPSFAFFSGLGPTMKDAVTTNLHLKCCPARPPAYTALRFLHTKPSAFALSIRCHGCFADSQHVANSAEVLGQVHITDFVRLDAQVRVVHAEQVPDVETGIGDFAV